MAVQTESVRLAREVVQELVTKKVSEVARQPEHAWGDDFHPYMTDEDGRPVVRVGVANCAIDFGNCCRERGQKGQLYMDYVCARCEAICAAAGVRKAGDEVNRINGR